MGTAGLQSGQADDGVTDASDPPSSSSAHANRRQRRAHLQWPSKQTDGAPEAAPHAATSPVRIPAKTPQRLLATVTWRRAPAVGCLAAAWAGGQACHSKVLRFLL